MRIIFAYLEDLSKTDRRSIDKYSANIPTQAVLITSLWSVLGNATNPSFKENWQITDMAFLLHSSELRPSSFIINLLTISHFGTREGLISPRNDPIIT
ncbi:hypothetical protein AVEN_148280-1 [Araneus ventricosus]|uniref:Uncharacterized protein n=1 Tax=Araneus ventricosus TaxID=182803 RepID=A0A4Y2LFK4_ARAVE|nr:hypothetical protein AVEN_233379-1 [Araneus ventricosus]GBN13324.1 hypothetical protein AVEN_148280-1 [Araneus ventricosus]